MKYFLGSTAGAVPLRELEESLSLSQKAQEERGFGPTRWGDGARRDP